MLNPFAAWQRQVLELIPGSMIYTVDLRRMYKEGLAPDAAAQAARNRGEVHKRGSAEAPAPVTYPKGRRRLAGIKRKPHWSLALIQAKIAAAAFAVLAEAETHRLEPDAVAYVREMKKKLAGA